MCETENFDVRWYRGIVWIIGSQFILFFLVCAGLAEADRYGIHGC